MVQWVTWWPESNIFWEQVGIPERGTGALVATFSEFPPEMTRVVLAALRT
jgi:hypothetical protein